MLTSAVGTVQWHMDTWSRLTAVARNCTPVVFSLVGACADIAHTLVAALPREVVWLAAVSTKDLFGFPEGLCFILFATKDDASCFVALGFRFASNNQYDRGEANLSIFISLAD